jgi:fucose permease
LAWGIMALIGRGIPVPPSHPRPKEHSYAALPRAFWVYWLVIFLSVSVEWSMVFWGADFLAENTTLSQVNAATAMTVFFIAMVVGRAAGSYLSRIFPSNSLLVMAGILTMVGFLPFWLSGAALPSLFGLFIVGLGVANLFPLTLVAASSVVSEEMTNAASGRVTLGSGCAMLIMPQILGSLADLTSIQTAYGVIAVVIALVIAVMVYQLRQPLPKVQEEAELESRVGVI